jgi:hypothetical protein
MAGASSKMAYERYTIHTQLAPNRADHPHRFEVKLNRLELAKLLLKEMIETRGNWRVVRSRPCVYGVFSGPLGGFLPRQEHCVGCLRCTIQHPKVVQILPGRDRLQLGDGFFTPDRVDTVMYEAATGRVPVRGAGYGGAFGGSGWDGMWTDMSEIVRPTRDGIHGREFISTAVDVGSKADFLQFNEQGEIVGEKGRWVTLPIPFLLDLPPGLSPHAHMLQEAARQLGTRLAVPLRMALDLGMDGESLLPILEPEDIGDLPALDPTPDIVALTAWEERAVAGLRRDHPDLVIGLRGDFGVNAVKLAEAGVDFIHLTADYHGGTGEGFVMDAIRGVHDGLVEARLRQRLSLLGSGGIIAAEHVPKAIICGLDAIALDTPLLIALQAKFIGEMRARDQGQVETLEFPEEWGVRRIKNLLASWRDQLLEILGAMGMREVRRLRGERGRAMFQADLEREAFAGIDGYEGGEHG